MNVFGLTLGVMIILLGAKPAVIKAWRSVRKVRSNLKDLERRRRALSLQVRTLARESLNQRLLSSADARDADALTHTIQDLQAGLDNLQGIDRRIIVMDERRATSEASWIVMIRRSRAATVPANEPPSLSRLWQDGRCYHFFAADESRVRRKVGQHFSPGAGYEIMAIYPFEGDLTKVAKLPEAVPAKA